MWDGYLGHIIVAVHRIELTPSDTRPIHLAPYRAGPKARNFEKTEIDNMSWMGLIEPAPAERASPIVLVVKQDGSLHLCVDY